ncbi:MAG TPA: hypothetical protein VFZ43_03775 [Anaerolineales bacterium]
MSEQTFLSVLHIAGGLLALAIVPLCVGITLFVSRGGLQGNTPRTLAFYILERGSILMSVILTALGLMVLETIFQGSAERTAAHIGAMAYFFGAILLVVAEAMSMTQNTYPLIVRYRRCVALIEFAASLDRLDNSRMEPGLSGHPADGHAGRHLLPHCPSPHAPANRHSLAVERVVLSVSKQQSSAQSNHRPIYEIRLVQSRSVE